MRYPTDEELKQTITIRIALYLLTKDLAAALFLSQLDYWRRRTKDPNGWIYKTQKELEKEIFLTPYQQRRARKILVTLGLIEEKCAGLPKKIYFRIKTDIGCQLEDQDTAQQEVKKLHNNNESNLNNECEETALMKVDKVEQNVQETSSYSIIGKITHEITAENTTKTLRNSICKPEELIFFHWKKVMGHPNAKMDKKRKQLIKSALSLGYSVDDICHAIDGCSVTPHNVGDNEKGERYDGLHIILKSADQIDRFINNFHAPPKKLTPADRLAKENMDVVDRWINMSERN